MNTEAERIMALEVRVLDLLEGQAEMNKKLDDLLQIKYKGIGAFWLASTIIGTGIIGLITQFSQWWHS